MHPRKLRLWANLLVIGSLFSLHAEGLQTIGYFDLVLGHNRYDSQTWGFNLYHFTLISYFPVTERIRVVGDVTYEHGPIHESSNIGDIKVRAFAELKVADWLAFNVGKFLCPFGEYNIYHDATPAYVSVNSPRSLYWKRTLGLSAASRPDSIVYEKSQDRLFAKEAAGIWVRGTVDIRTYLLEYNAYVANGRGKGNQYKIDDNEDKGLGAKITLQMPFNLKIGGSYYQDRNGKWKNEPLQRTGAVQASFEFLSAKISGELMISRLERAFEKDLFDDALGGYGQLEYTLFERFTPYLRYDYFSSEEIARQEETVLVGGLNFMIHPKAYLKAEYNAYNQISDRIDDVFQSQIAIMF